MKFTTLNDILEHAVKLNPEGTAFMEMRHGDWFSVTYAEFKAGVDATVEWLRTKGIRKGDRIAVISNNSIAWATMAFACYRIGAIYVPMYESQKEDDWGYILKDSGAKMVFGANEHIWALINRIKRNDPDALGELDVVEFWERKRCHPPVSEAFFTGPRRLYAVSDPVTSDDLAMLIYTSGTTGKPKGVMLSHGNIASVTSGVQQILPVDRADCSLAILPWAHIYGFAGELLCLLSRGGTIAICEGAEHVMSNLLETRPTILFAVPRVFNKIRAGVLKQMEGRSRIIRNLFEAGLRNATKRRNGERIGLIGTIVLWLATNLIFAKIVAKFGGRLKYAVTGGASIALEVAELIDALNITVFEGYGMTECPVVATNHPKGRKMGTVGRPIPGTTVKIDPETGEIIAYGPGVMKGYWGKPSEGASALREDGGLRTGDMGTLDDDGYLRITGRIKEQYKLENGKYVVPTPLEDKLKLSPLITNVMIYGDNRPFNVAIVAMDASVLKDRFGIESAVDGLVNDRIVRTELMSELGRLSAEWKSYERIRAFAIVVGDFTQENGLLTPSQKLRRSVAVERFGPIIEDLYSRASVPATIREAEAS